MRGDGELPSFSPPLAAGCTGRGTEAEHLVMRLADQRLVAEGRRGILRVPTLSVPGPAAGGPATRLILIGFAGERLAPRPLPVSRRDLRRSAP